MTPQELATLWKTPETDPQSYYVKAEVAEDARCGDWLSLDETIGKLSLATGEGSIAMCTAPRDLRRGEMVSFDPATGQMGGE